MNNLIEKGRERLRDREQIKASCKEIFTTAIDLLETNGRPVRDRLFFKHQVVQRAMNSRKPEVHVEIVTGADLERARKVSIRIQGVGRLDIRKTGVKGQEEFKGEGFREYSTYGEDLNASWNHHIGIVHGYLGAIRQVRSEIRPY